MGTHFALIAAGVLTAFGVLVAVGIARRFRFVTAIVWRPAIWKFERLDKQHRSSPDAILCYGSSTIRRWETIADDLAPFPVIQRGFGGARMCDVLRFADRVVGPHQPRSVLIYVANDITGAWWDAEPAEVAALFAETVDVIRRRLPQTPIVYVHTNPTPRRARAWPLIAEANARINNFCLNTANAFAIDATSAICDSHGKPIREMFVDDEIHLTRDGYRMWSRVVRDEMCAILNPVCNEAQLSTDAEIGAGGRIDESGNSLLLNS